MTVKHRLIKAGAAKPQPAKWTLNYASLSEDGESNRLFPKTQIRFVLIVRLKDGSQKQSEHSKLPFHQEEPGAQRKEHKPQANAPSVSRTAIWRESGLFDHFTRIHHLHGKGVVLHPEDDSALIGDLTTQQGTGKLRLDLFL